MVILFKCFCFSSFRRSLWEILLTGKKTHSPVQPSIGGARSTQPRSIDHNKQATTVLTTCYSYIPFLSFTMGRYDYQARGPILAWRVVPSLTYVNFQDVQMCTVSAHVLQLQLQLQPQCQSQHSSLRFEQMFTSQFSHLTESLWFRPWPENPEKFVKDRIIERQLIIDRTPDQTGQRTHTSFRVSEHAFVLVLPSQYPTKQLSTTQQALSAGKGTPYDGVCVMTHTYIYSLERGLHMMAYA